MVPLNGRTIPVASERGKAVFQRTEVAQFFPTCVWSHELTEAATLNAALLAEVRRLRGERPSRSKFSGHWQSEGDLYRLPAFKPLVEAIVAAAKGVVGFLAWDCQGLQITDLWANVNDDDFAHHQHSHPNNFFGGVYYVEATPDSGDIVFYDPRPQAHVLEPKAKERNPFNAAKQRITPQPGRLLLFPAWLEHSVDRNKSGKPRVSVAFNLALKGLIGSESGRVQF